MQSMRLLDIPLMAATGCTLNHTLREENRTADGLVNMGVDQQDKMVSHINPPDDIIPLLEVDMRGVSFVRLSFPFFSFFFGTLEILSFSIVYQNKNK